VQHFFSGFLSVKEVASLLGKSQMTIIRWCESGRLPASSKPYGDKITFLITPQAVELLKHQLETKAQEKTSKAEAKAKKPERIEKPHKAYFDAWIKAMAQGTLNGRVFSSETIDAYHYRAEKFLKSYPVVSLESLEKALLAVPVDSFAVREKLYKAVICFAKFLQRQGALGEDFQKQAKPLAPKAHKPPKRHTVAADDLKVLFQSCDTPHEWVLLHLLAHTGIRASELCSLTLADIDLEKGAITIELGKGGKKRRIGLSKAALDAIALFLAKCPPTSATSPLFLNGHGVAFNRYNLYQLLQKIGDRAKVKISPHALRRAFVTINANKGRPLQMLQIACGHSKITTTMGYCRTSEQEVIDAMKVWD
jgi:excisionase family DNA binding protein